MLKDRDNRTRDLLKFGSCWARNLELTDKKTRLSKFNKNRTLALNKLVVCIEGLKVDHWRKRLSVKDRIDVLFNTKPNPDTNPYIHATIAEVRLVPDPNNQDEKDPFLEFRIGFRIYCDDGEDEDNNSNRYNGWAEE